MDAVSKSTKQANAFREALIAKASPDPLRSRLRMEPFSPEGREILLEWVKSDEFGEMLESTGMTVYDTEPESFDQ